MFLCLPIFAAFISLFLGIRWIDPLCLSPSLGIVALCSRCFVELSGADSLITWAMCSKNIPYVYYVSPPIVVESWLLLAPPWLGLSLRLAGCMDWPWPQCMSCYIGADPWSRIHTSRVWCLWSFPCEFVTYGANCIMLWCGLNPAIWYLVLVPLGKDFNAGHCQTLLVVGPWVPIR